jgi:hypothetical protein
MLLSEPVFAGQAPQSYSLRTRHFSLQQQSAESPAAVFLSAAGLSLPQNIEYYSFLLISASYQQQLILLQNESNKGIS